MMKLFQKDEITFALLWIVIYVVGMSNADMLSVSLGMPKVITVCFGLLLSLVLFLFIQKNGLKEYFGLCRFRGKWKDALYFIPLIVLSSMNLWNGVTMNYDLKTTIFYVISMWFVAFLEEVIFRGFLFKAMCKSNIRTAILVSSLTFGMGHIINLLMGEPVLSTVLQLVYAAAVGFCFTVIFYVGGSIVPCILSHGAVNSLSAFAIKPSNEVEMLFALVMTVISVSYGLFLLRSNRMRYNES